VLCCHSNEINRCTDCKSAQQCTTRGTPYHSTKLHPGPCSSVGMQQGTDRQTDTQTDTQTHVTTIHFASSLTHAKCNNELTIMYAQTSEQLLHMISTGDEENVWAQYVQIPSQQQLCQLHSKQSTASMKTSKLQNQRKHLVTNWTFIQLVMSERVELSSHSMTTEHAYFITVALWNRADHYYFPPVVCCSSSIYLFFLA